MNDALTESALREYLTKHLAEVFSTMLSLPAAPTTAAPPANESERISGSVGFVGNTVTGAVYLHVPVAFATHITCTMLGMPETEVPAATDVNDVMGEITNMLAGGLKSWLCDAGAACALSIPAIIRGRSFQILASEGVTQIHFGFASGAHQGLAELHIKFTD